MPSDSSPSQSRKIALIASSIGWGSGLEAAERGPALLLGAGLAEKVCAKKVIEISSIPRMSDATLEESAIEQAIMEHAKRVSDAVVDAIGEGFFPVIIGGDHTSAIGFHTGLARAYGQTGIIWVDTHPDLNTPETSPSGNIHGMVLAGLLGHGSAQMLGATSASQTRDEHVAMVGIRSIDEGEQQWLNDGRIRCMTMDAVHEHGLEACMSDAVETANRAEAGFGLTIDIDVLDPPQVPFVATPVEGGIDSDHLAAAMTALPQTNRLLGVEVVEFTPRDDSDAEAACAIIATLVNAVTSVPAV